MLICRLRAWPTFFLVSFWGKILKGLLKGKRGCLHKWNLYKNRYGYTCVLVNIKHITILVNGMFIVEPVDSSACEPQLEASSPKTARSIERWWRGTKLLSLPNRRNKIRIHGGRKIPKNPSSSQQAPPSSPNIPLKGKHQ